MPAYSNPETRREMDIPGTFDIEYMYRGSRNNFINRISKDILDGNSIVALSSTTLIENTNTYSAFSFDNIYSHLFPVRNELLVNIKDIHIRINNFLRNKLDFEKLEEALTDAQKFRKKAIAATGSTVDNQLRGLLFWPALMITFANAHEAIMAESERSVHLINIMICNFFS